MAILAARIEITAIPARLRPRRSGPMPDVSTRPWKLAVRVCFEVDVVLCSADATNLRPCSNRSRGASHGGRVRRTESSGCQSDGDSERSEVQRCGESWRCAQQPSACSLAARLRRASHPRAQRHPKQARRRRRPRPPRPRRAQLLVTPRPRLFRRHRALRQGRQRCQRRHSNANRSGAQPRCDPQGRRN